MQSIASLSRRHSRYLVLTLHDQLELLCSRAFILTLVHMDPQSVFRALTTQFLGVVIDVEDAGDYVSKVDAKTCHIKELYRSVKAGLPHPGSYPQL
jgi:hypothetical protein